MNKRKSREKNTGWFFLFALCLVFLLSGCGRSESNASKTPKAKLQSVRYSDRYFDISTIGSDHVWVVGYSGTIIHSQDGGKSWSRQEPGTQEALLGVYFVNDHEGWVVGDLGTILHTQDGGAKWVKQICPGPESKEKLLKAFFVNEREGWVTGTYGVILHTIDGGNGWERLPFREDLTLNDLFFVNASEGWAAGEFETILHTTDGGKIWEKQRGEKDASLFGITFRDPLHGIAIGTQGRVLITEDGGKNWGEIKSPALTDTLLKVQFQGQGSSKAIAIGLRGLVVQTEDDGRNWSIVPLSDHYTWLSGLKRAEGGTWFLVGDLGTIFMGTGDGKNWERFKSN
jgi:photosystem II stability/assembly factor-like uncharacterized protein